MKKNKKIIKTIISNTVIFVGVVLFVALFKTIFGNENTQIGVSTIVLSLSLLSRDLTTKSGKNFMFLIGFNVITVLGAYIFQSYLWLGLITNFLIIAGICYLFTYEIKKPFNMLFGLQYILIIGSPIVSQQLPKRLLAAVVSACIIMVLQLLVNKNKLHKSAKKTLILIEQNILLKINLIRENKETDSVNKSIDNLINNFKISIFESGQTDFKITTYSGVLVDILSCFEKINSLLNNLDENEDILKEIMTQFENVKSGNFDPNNMDRMLLKNRTNFVVVSELINDFETLQQKVKEFEKITTDNADDLSSNIDINEEFNLGNWHKKNIKNISYIVAYAIRVGTLFALTGFVTKLFDLEFGKWMMFTVFALTQPYAEYSYLKTKKRIFGTIIGALIILVSFLIIQDSSVRMGMILVAGYLLAYFEDYKYKAILITICATCIDAVSHTNPYYVILSRVMFVMIGVILSLIANKFLLRREYRDAELTLITMQNEIANKMMDEVVLSEDTNSNSIRNLFLILALIEDRINSLNLQSNNEFVLKNKLIVNDLYQLYLSGNDKHKIV